jgi:hypothetical protein
MRQPRYLERSVATVRLVCVGVLCMVCGSRAQAEEGGQFYGLLRVRDLTPFGSLRLDMRPAHAIAIKRGSFAFETEVGYQNTWALSPEVERWLTERESLGRHELGPADVQAIRDLPGENYLLDSETAVIDVTVHYKFSQNMSAYLIANAITYGGGFLDSTIESFHDTFGFSSFGRPAVSKNDFSLIYDLNHPTSRTSSSPRTAVLRTRHLACGTQVSLSPIIGAWASRPQ